MKLEEIYWKDVKQPRGNVDEKCWFEPLEFGPPCPSFRLTIEESWSETQERLATITATIRIDAGVRKFVAKHPLWSKDCRPFLLWQIYEAFWRVKLMEAGFGASKSYTVLIGDPKRDAMTSVTITAQAFYEGNGA